MSSMFRVNWPDMFVKKETALEHFKKPLKNDGSGKFIKKLKDEHYNETVKFILLYSSIFFYFLQLNILKMSDNKYS